MQMACKKRPDPAKSRQPGAGNTRLRPRAGWRAACWSTLLIGIATATVASAGEGPYFVTYSQQMEEPGNLEVTSKSVIGRPQGGNRFLGTAVEFEYGLKGWWTMELYVDGQSTANESTFLTGYRWENRFRLLAREHWINPVLYVEYEHLNGADRALLEVVGHDGQADLAESVADGREQHAHELETKLILGSNFKGWNVSENFIVEKNLTHAPYEFGYAVATSRPLALAARAERCTFCPERIRVGVEVYGGLGTSDGFGWRDTSHYIAPTVSMEVGNGTTLMFSPGFGLTGSSAPFLLRFGVSYEIAQLGRAASRLWR